MPRFVAWKRTPVVVLFSIKPSVTICISYAIQRLPVFSTLPVVVLIAVHSQAIHVVLTLELQCGSQLGLYVVSKASHIITDQGRRNPN